MQIIIHTQVEFLPDVARYEGDTGIQSERLFDATLEIREPLNLSDVHFTPALVEHRVDLFPSALLKLADVLMPHLRQLDREKALLYLNVFVLGQEQQRKTQAHCRGVVTLKIADPHTQASKTLFCNKLREFFNCLIKFK